MTICLDSEPELSKMGVLHNHSMGICHYNTKHSIYLKMQNKKRGTCVKIQNDEYEIAQIIDRKTFTYGFIFNKMVNEGSFPFINLSANTAEELKNNLINYMTSENNKIATEALENRINMYLYRGSGIGSPIEFISIGNYDDYIDTVLELLYNKNLDFIPGRAILKDDGNSQYVISLSSLVVMAITNLLDLLMQISDRVIIADSLVDFVKKRVLKTGNNMINSKGKLFLTNDNKFYIKDTNKLNLDIWNKIYEVCQEFKQIPVTRLDKIDYKINENIIAESFFSSLKIHHCQLDSIIIADRYNCIFVCDDLFLRLIACENSIKNTNFSFLINMLENTQQQEKCLCILSQTNYM